MAQEEARAMLDTLMGADRNAPLPKGAAIPRQSSSRRSKKKKRDDDDYDEQQQQLWLSASSKRRSASCYDPDIDPLFVAWGVDVYELFVNTKSDLGANPYTTQRRLADHESARQEYLTLSPSEKQSLGFEYKLFQKLSELVKSCDRIVQRNKEKLYQELQQKQRQKSAASLDYHVEVIEEAPLESLVRNMVQLEQLQQTIERLIEKDLVDITARETKLKQDLQQARQKQQQLQQEQQQQSAATNTANDEVPTIVELNENTSLDENDQADATIIVKVKHEDGVLQEEVDSSQANQVNGDGALPVIPKTEPTDEIEDASAAPAATTSNGAPMPFGPILSSPEIQSLQMELGRLTLQKQKLLVDIGYKMQHEYVPLKEAVEKQTNHLQQVKSDTTTDKTVCEVSGNFMSARDADERIAAHYAGKQYVGWKLVRSKFKEMMDEYGRNGPPRPNSAPPPPHGAGAHYSRGAPPPQASSSSRDDSYHHHHHGGSHSGGGGGSSSRPGRYDRGSRSNQDRGSSYRSGSDRGGGGGTSGGGDWRRSGGGGGGGGSGGRRSPSPQYWERRGGGSSGSRERRSNSGGGNSGGGGGHRGSWRR